MIPLGADLAAGAPKQAEEKEPLKVDLPKPMFVGTPKNINSDNLETRDSKYVYDRNRLGAKLDKETREQLATAGYLSPDPAGSQRANAAPTPSGHVETDAMGMSGDALAGKTQVAAALTPLKGVIMTELPPETTIPCACSPPNFDG